MRLIPLILAMAITLIPVLARADAIPEADAAPPIAGCDPMDIGPVYDASFDTAATLACLQLVTPAGSPPTKLDINLAGFATDVIHDVRLIRVAADGSTHVVASDASTDAFRILQGMGNPSTRWLVLVGRPQANSLTSFQVQATVAYGSDRYEANDAIAKATVLQGNQRIEANLDNPMDTDHYLISVRADQVQTIVEFEAPPGVVAKLIDGANNQYTLQAGRSARMNSSRPLFFTVRGTETVGAGTRYTLRTRDPRAFAVVSRVHSNENISHLAPGLGLSVPGEANAGRTLEVEATVFEGDGETVVGAGERVMFDALNLDGFKPKTHKWILTSAHVVTDANGVARATLNLGPCKGGTSGPFSIPTRDNPPNYWSITYNPTSLVVATVPGNESPSSPLVDLTRKPFQHICKEVFRGSRP